MTDRNPIVLMEMEMAKTCVTDAETDLGRLLKEIEVAPRAEKTAITEALRQAFEKLRDAREHLDKLETMIRTKDD